MTIISINELEIEKFIKRICRFMWKLDNDDLYNLITPWLNYIDQKRSKFFINFYLSPRLLYEMENFELGSENQK